MTQEIDRIDRFSSYRQDSVYDRSPMINKLRILNIQQSWGSIVLDRAKGAR